MKENTWQAKAKSIALKNEKRREEQCDKKQSSAKITRSRSASRYVRTRRIVSFCYCHVFVESLPCSCYLPTIRLSLTISHSISLSLSLPLSCLLFPYLSLSLSISASLFMSISLSFSFHFLLSLAFVTISRLSSCSRCLATIRFHIVLSCALPSHLLLIMPSTSLPQREPLLFCQYPDCLQRKR